MSKSSLCDCSDVHILVRGMIKNVEEGNTPAATLADKRGQGVISKNCKPFTDCITKVNNIQIDNT